VIFTPGTSWRNTPALSLLIDNRTVLHLLNALQYLQVPLPGGGVESRRLSFRGLDIEQIGHVYEGLLDHTTKRAQTTILGLIGAAKTEPETTLDTLEELTRKGEQVLLDYLKDATERSIPSLQKQLAHTSLFTSFLPPQSDAFYCRVTRTEANRSRPARISCVPTAVYPSSIPVRSVPSSA
jgi:hypothetical protein